MNVSSIGKSDKGARRSNNEDAFIILPNNLCSAVADGMGGAAAGEIASKIFVDTVHTIFASAKPATEDDVGSLVREAFKRGNEKIIRTAEAIPEHRGMGCTAELLAFSDNRYTVGHVGDSRTYLFRAGRLRQLTRDHSLVQQQVEQGLISPWEARGHARKNIILRALGMEESLSLDIIRGGLLPHDTFLLCSDGLSDMIDDEGIVDILSSRYTLGDKVDMLIEKAISAGGRDNVTVVLCEVRGG